MHLKLDLASILPIFNFVSLFVKYDAMELPGQQLSAATAYSPLDHVLNLDIKLPAACQRLTGIIATIGEYTGIFIHLKTHAHYWTYASRKIVTAHLPSVAIMATGVHL